MAEKVCVLKIYVPFSLASFGYFYFFSGGGRERGSPRRRCLLKVPVGGGSFFGGGHKFDENFWPSSVHTALIV